MLGVEVRDDGVYHITIFSENPNVDDIKMTINPDSGLMTLAQFGREPKLGKDPSKKPTFEEFSTKKPNEIVLDAKASHALSQVIEMALKPSSNDGDDDNSTDSN